MYKHLCNVWIHSWNFIKNSKYYEFKIRNIQLVISIMELIIITQIIQLISIEISKTMSRDDIPLVTIFLTCDFRVNVIWIPLTTTKFLGMTLHWTVGLAAHNISTIDHPWTLIQHTTARESFVSQHFSSKRMDESMNESHPPHRALNRPNGSNNG